MAAELKNHLREGLSLNALHAGSDHLKGRFLENQDRFIRGGTSKS
jgi:hypothetical protein